MSETPFWDTRKSATLSVIVSWVALVVAAVVAVFLWPILQRTSSGVLLGDRFAARVVGPAYVCLAAGIVAIVILLLILGDIRRGEVFTLANARRLRLISYCGLTIMAACAVAGLIAGLIPVFALLALVAGFMALMMNVIKNVVDAARLLKEDADYTI